MRVLLTTYPEKTLYLAMAPLAWALRTAGHDVRVASTHSFTDVITTSGITANPIGRPRERARTLAAFGVTTEVLEQTRGGLDAPWDAVEDMANATWDRMLRGYRDAVTHAFKPETFPVCAELVEFARAWSPDLVVWEPLSVAGAIAARASGAASARLLWSLDVFAGARARFRQLLAARPSSEREDPLGEWLGGYARRYGDQFAEDMVTGHFTIDQLPESLRLRAPDVHYLPMRFVPYGGPAIVPSWLMEPPRRPRIALTLGSTATDSFAGYHVDVQAVLDAVAACEVEVVATLAESATAGLRVPANVRVVPFVPLDVLAATCSVAVHHGGFGTMNTFLRHGVPQILLPHHFDEPMLAHRLAVQGAGVVVGSTAELGAAVQRLCHEPGPRKAAAALRVEVEQLPTPHDVVAELTQLTSRYRRR